MPRLTAVYACVRYGGALAESTVWQCAAAPYLRRSAKRCVFLKQLLQKGKAASLSGTAAVYKSVSRPRKHGKKGKVQRTGTALIGTDEHAMVKF
ncbi:hypothetical protein NPIL_439261 [Nephila pilipes]|uniref:Uncharacterized protein n=1 Tax=Nephila pilipes TaxID=299642 RepID=A0A8X6N5F1_NEPPI|nr:hypothetical protein NPIL_439261 [Nephila pilipes]